MLSKILEVARLSDENVLIEGVHGIGKSQQVKDYAKKYNLHLEILYLSHQEVGDLIGMPTIVNNITIWTQPSWLVRMEEATKNGQGCVLFLDELNRAQRDVRQTALQITLEKKLHDHDLPSFDGLETLVIAAINPDDDTKIDYQVDELDAALKDRFLHYEMKLDVKAWLRWARENKISDEITFFITEFPDRLFYFTQEPTYPTPRSWAKLSQVLKNSSRVNETTRKTIIYGKLGQSIGSQFFSYHKNFSKVITMKYIEEFILENILLDKNEMRSKIQKEILYDRPKIWISEIADRLFIKYIKSKKNQNILISFLDSIDLEILASIFENIKERNKNTLVKFTLLDGGNEIISKIANKIEF
ncbi:MAG: hypothetical protein DRG78_00925 [Epsilonproteobacteria bacterium]|nr:MAG: hypothetical protein DRG78_00925 [Campylobacterota bacterium]